MAEEARVRVRGSRRTGIDEIKKIEKAGEITEDERHDLEEGVQKLTDKYVQEVDSHAETKETDIMKV
jgi:ribosome recycling factor